MCMHRQMYVRVKWAAYTQGDITPKDQFFLSISDRFFSDFGDFVASTFASVNFDIEKIIDITRLRLSFVYVSDIHVLPLWVHLI